MLAKTQKPKVKSQKAGDKIASYTEKKINHERTKDREFVDETDSEPSDDEIDKSSPKRKNSSGGGKRHDEETGVLLKPQTADKHSACDALRFLSSKKHETHPLAYACGIYNFVGGLGSGKSTCIFTIMEEFAAILKEKTLGRVIYYTGSAGDKVLDMYDEDEVELYDPKSKESFLAALREICEESGEIPHEKKKMNIIVVEDALNDADILPFSIKSETPLSKLMISCRHIPCAILISGQKYTALPTFARSNASHIFIFGSQSDSEIAAIAKDVSFTKDTFKKAMLTLTKPKDSLWVQNKNRKIVSNLVTPLIH